MTLTVLEVGTLTTIQDRGRIGLAHLGVPRAGCLDAPAADLANRLVGNGADAAVLEVTFGGLAVTTSDGRWVAVTGAPCRVSVDGDARGHTRAEWVPPGSTLRLGAPEAGVRSYLAISGGVDVPLVLGSRSTDTLAWVGPPRVEPGTVLPVADPVGRPRALDTPRPRASGPLRILPGPRADWFEAAALDVLCGTAYAVQSDSNRIGLRLAGPALERQRPGELASEGLVLGAVQVPPDGQPLIFLADHPSTGGYPVIAVVAAEDLWQCAQLRPGDEVHFRLDRGGPGS